jgi:ubiquinone/menaquinone biosynthesis C-methylase UbiE
MSETSWQKISKWYGETVGEKGSYYHQNVILPNVLRLLSLRPRMILLDLGCGQGVLARLLPTDINYIGVDVSDNLINQARELDKNPKHSFLVADITSNLNLRPNSFDLATMILVIQNVKKPFKTIENAYKALKPGGKLIIVLNHPCFRIPKNSDWFTDRQKRLQSRIVDNYMTPLEVPIDSSPFDKKDNQTSLSFHYPLSAYSEMLFDNGFLTEKIEEWVSDKKSEGMMAPIEDKARGEFPLFMAIVARKN